MIIKNYEQYSEEWWACRLGKPSASRFKEIVSSTGKPSTSWKEYAYELMAYKKLGYQPETYKSEDMKKGSELEAEARAFYEFNYNLKVEQVGSIFNDDETILCSPDGIIPVEKKGLEIKCPKPGTHMRYLTEKKIPSEYAPQVYGSLYICDKLLSWDFFSYYPGLEPFVISVNRESEGFLNWVAVFRKQILNMLNFIS